MINFSVLTIITSQHPQWRNGKGVLKVYLWSNQVKTKYWLIKLLTALCHLMRYGIGQSISSVDFNTFSCARIWAKLVELLAPDPAAIHKLIRELQNFNNTNLFLKYIWFSLKQAHICMHSCSVLAYFFSKLSGIWKMSLVLFMLLFFYLQRLWKYLFCLQWQQQL